MTPAIKPLLLALAIVMMMVGVVSGGYIIYDQHNNDVKTKLEHQMRYPYSCAVPDELWDACIDSSNVNYFSLIEENRTCMNVWYSITNWDNTHVYTYNSDGIKLYKSDGYDSNGAWHQSSEWRTCS